MGGIVFSDKKFKLVDTTFFAQARLIPLETTDNAQIRRIDGICASGDTLFLWDRLQKKIFIYDMNGKFIHTIQDIGNGPNEYVSISDICVYNKQLLCLYELPHK